VAINSNILVDVLSLSGVGLAIAMMKMHWLQCNEAILMVVHAFSLAYHSPDWQFGRIHEPDIVMLDASIGQIVTLQEGFAFRVRHE
jgi:hypothetical protein